MRGRGSGASDEFIREVDEAVRQDRWLELWRHYGTYIIGGALAIVIGTGAGVAWRNYQESQREEEARRYAAAEELLRRDRPSEAAAAFLALAEDAGGGYDVLARLRAAEAQLEAGEADAAAASLARLAEDGAAPQVYRQLGDLLALQQSFDGADAAALSGRLAGLSEANAPWRYSALELEALAQLRAGAPEAARRTLETLLADPLTPGDLSRRAAELLASLGGPLESAEDATAAEDAP
ncbi:MAG TPA: tetratricopeptide repeat protein [Geminicoccaceae bacterium]|nr:tetratricopeptide repeat protein [Geminicoccaceae bacterium]